MNMSKFSTLTMAALLAGGMLAACDSNGGSSKTQSTASAAAESSKPLTVERKIEGKVRARVRAIDQATRQVTLEDEKIHAETFIVGPQVKRLAEVKAGDYVEMGYTATLVAELRPPTAEESAAPIAAVQVAGRAPKSSDPAAGEAMGVRVVTTVQAIDIPNMLVTLQGPLGDQVTVRARSKENIQKLHIGDTIVITYVEAVAISLEKAMR